MKRLLILAILIVAVVVGASPVFAGTADVVKQKTMEAARDYMTSGNMLAGEGKYGAAVKSYKQAIGMDPNLVEAYTLMGSALAEDGKFKEAEEALRKAISLKPNFAEGYYHLGLFLKSQNRQSEADEAFRKAQQYGR